MGKKQWRKSRHEVLSDFVIWMLYNKAVHWLIILQMPYFVILQPIIDYIGFKWLALVLTYFCRKGSAASQDIGQFIMTMMNTTIFYCQIMIGPWFIFKRTHGCGPIEDGQRAWDPVTAEIYESKWKTYLYTTFSFFPILWLAMSILVFVYLKTWNTSETQKIFSDSKMEEYEQILNE